jgi:hypothetical protein
MARGCHAINEAAESGAPVPGVPGDHFDAVLLGCVLAGHLRLWRPDGEPDCVRVPDAERLARLLARGFAARTSPEPRRFREVGLLNRRTGVLTIMGRPRGPVVDTGIESEGFAFEVESCEEPGPTQQLWASAVAYLRDATVRAVTRGEFVVIEQGGWDAIPEPYALACALHTAQGWVSHIEASPAPLVPPWLNEADREPQSGLGAPATSQAFSVSGYLLCQAISTWAGSPFDVVVTFGENPQGPLPGYVASRDAAPGPDRKRPTTGERYNSFGPTARSARDDEE